MLGHAPLAAGSRRFRGRLDAREPAMGPKQVPITVLAWSRTKGTSYPSVSECECFPGMTAPGRKQSFKC